MSDQLHLTCCPFLTKEIDQLLTDEIFKEYRLAPHYGAVSFSSKDLASFSDDLKMLRLGCAEKNIHWEDLLSKYHPCLELLIGKKTSHKLKEAGQGILIPSMIAPLIQFLKDHPSKKNLIAFKQFLILDTKISPKLLDLVPELTLLMGVPIKVLKISLDLLEQKLEMFLQIWHQYQNSAMIDENLFSAQKEKANYAIILDFIGRIQRLDTNIKIISNLLDLVAMISSSNSVFFLDSEEEFFSFSEIPDIAFQEELKSTSKSEVAQKDHHYFFKMKYREDVLGTLIIQSQSPEKIASIQTFLGALLNFAALALDKLSNMNELTKKRELEAIHAMIATYNHEINNPLSVAIGYATVLEKKQDFKYVPEIRKSLSKIEEIVEKISEITKNDLSFADYTKESQRLKID